MFLLTITVTPVTSLALFKGAVPQMKTQNFGFLLNYYFKNFKRALFCVENDDSTDKILFYQ